MLFVKLDLVWLLGISVPCIVSPSAGISKCLKRDRIVFLYRDTCAKIFLLADNVCLPVGHDLYDRNMSRSLAHLEFLIYRRLWNGVNCILATRRCQHQCCRKK